MKTVLFVCSDNSQSSQLAHAFANMYGRRKMTPYSAGLFPAGKINKQVILAMEELEYDLEGHKPKSISQIPAIHYDLLVEIGCSIGPKVEASQRIAWNFPVLENPKMNDMRINRKLVELKVKELINQL